MNFQPSDTFQQEWKKSIQQRTKGESFHVANLPAQCTDQVMKWAKAITPHETTPPSANFIKEHTECQDPWQGRNQCSQAYEIPSYRLSDLVTYRPPGLPEYTQLFFP